MLYRRGKGGMIVGEPGFLDSGDAVDKINQRVKAAIDTESDGFMPYLRYASRIVTNAFTQIAATSCWVSQQQESSTVMDHP